MYHIGVWRQRAARAKISPCQLVNKWKRKDVGQIRVLISFHQLWMPAELKVNIWGFSKPSRCLESMDWLVLAAPLSVFVGRPGPISNTSQAHASQQLPRQKPLSTTIHYTTFLFNTSSTALFLIRLSSFMVCFTGLDMSHCRLCHALWHMVWVIWDLGNVCWETSEGRLLFMITWKTNVGWHWLEDWQSVFSQRLSNGENFFFDCKLKNTNMGGESTEGENISLFNSPSVYRHFQGCSLLITSLFLLPEAQSKNSVDKELCGLLLYLASFLSLGLQRI